VSTTEAVEGVSEDVDASRRQDLAAFLRARRDATRPQDVGLEAERGRHVPGLRREEVAELAGISTTWYTWMEQGREISVSPEVLVQVGRALNLTPRLVEYMGVLARPAADRRFDREPDIPEAIRALVQSHQLAPAYVATPRLDLLVWNDFVTDVFDYEFTADALSRNVLWRMFFDPTRRNVYVDWECTAAAAVANFRHVYASYRKDALFAELLEQLMQSNDFARLWKRWDVVSPADMPPFLVRHRTRGICELRPVQATLDMAPGCFIAVFNCKQIS
jgi:transcriptional regulator with XRE-family HTH domain